MGGTVPLETTFGVITDWVTIADGGARGRDGDVLSVDACRAPKTGEVWLSDRLGDDLGAEAGDTLELRRPAGSWIVTGTGRPRNDFDGRIMVLPHLPVEQFHAGVLTEFS